LISDTETSSAQAIQSIEKAKINDANPKRNLKPKSYFDAFALEANNRKMMVSKIDFFIF
jgi:hypothetical protein